MPFTGEEIKLHLRLGEDSGWEFKRVAFNGDRPVSPRRDDLADEICAFANVDGGVLLCGVTDSGDLSGMTREQLDNLERLLVEISQDTIKPRLNISVFRHEIDGNIVLLAEIPEGYAAHESPGGIWQRVGSSKRQLNSDERLRLAQRRGQARFVWYDEQPVPDTGFASLDEELWRPLLSATGASEPEIGLTRMHLLATDEHNVTRATVAGLLICSGSPHKWLNNAYITATHYLGNDRASRQIDTQDIHGPVQEQIKQALAFTIRNMRVSANKSPARVNLPQYSERVLFEAIVNAVVHRDYSIRNSRIRIAMFNDRVEINSPGSLPNNLTIDSMPNLQATRNEVIASLMGRVPTTGIAGAGDRQYIMERRGDGVAIIHRETQTLSGQLPVFELINDSEFRVTIPAAMPAATSAIVTLKIHCGGQPIGNADILIIMPNQTLVRLFTDERGDAEVELPVTSAPLTIFVAAQGYCGYVYRDLVDTAWTMEINMTPAPQGGSIIIDDGIGEIPGLVGRLNPVHDLRDRTFLYATDMIINGGRQQPVQFFPLERLRVTDEKGYEALVRVTEIIGRLSLIDYEFTRDS